MNSMENIKFCRAILVIQRRLLFVNITDSKSLNSKKLQMSKILKLQSRIGWLLRAHDCG